MDEDASLQARLLSQKGVAHDSDEEMHDEKEEDEHEDAEESDDEDMIGDAWNARVTALSKTGYMMSL
jgi:ribosomal protein L12E/L44/L45/RPP1/RPP2